MAAAAVLFAGQGAQSVGMGKDISQRSSDGRKLFDRAGEILGYDLAKLCFEGPAEELTRSDHCQPAIFVTSLACWYAFRAEVGDFEPVAGAGLSLGEWTALCAAGVLTFEDTVRALEARGRYMQEACDARRGGMVSVLGMTAEQAGELAARAGIGVANLNAPGQTVLSGAWEGVEEAARLAPEMGARKAVVLNVAGAFHSPLMQPAADKLDAFLQDVTFREPHHPVASNANGAGHGRPDDIRRAMVEQVTHPVRWIGCVEWMRSLGASRYVECGPGKVLSGLVKRIDTDAQVHTIQDVSTLEKATSDWGEQAGGTHGAV